MFNSRFCIHYLQAQGFSEVQKVSLNNQLSEHIKANFRLKEMENIWYLLKYPSEDEVDFKENCSEFIVAKELKEVIRFQCQRMMRYGGKWHMEKKNPLPGCVFLAGLQTLALKESFRKEKGALLIPCETPFLKQLCQEGNLIAMSRGVIREGKAVVLNGPLKGKEGLIQRIDRHKRTAEIQIPFVGEQKRVTVGLEIYEKQV